MIFALATDERTLMSFHDLNEAISYCEAIDIQAGGWEFWGKMGKPWSLSFLNRTKALAGMLRTAPIRCSPALVGQIFWRRCHGFGNWMPIRTSHP